MCEELKTERRKEAEEGKTKKREVSTQRPHKKCRWASNIKRWGTRHK